MTTVPVLRWTATGLLLTIVFLVAEGPAAQASPSRQSGPRAFELQGHAHRSPLENQQVVDVPGVVTALRPNGFYLQDPTGDGDPRTSDAVFVFTQGAPSVVVGDGVTVTG